MPDGMAGCVEEIERAIAKIVEAIERADLDESLLVLVKGNLPHMAPSNISVEIDRVWIGWIAGPVCVAYARTDDDVGRRWECRRITDMVEVRM